MAEPHFRRDCITMRRDGEGRLVMRFTDCQLAVCRVRLSLSPMRGGLVYRPGRDMGRLRMSVTEAKCTDLVVGDLRDQRIERKGGSLSWRSARRRAWSAPRRTGSFTSTTAGILSVPMPTCSSITTVARASVRRRA